MSDWTEKTVAVIIDDVEDVGQLLRLLSSCGGGE
jgi:hypothetical protein